VTPRAVGAGALVLFLCSIPFANWWLTQHGLYDAPWLGPIPSAVWIVGAAFVIRDLTFPLGRVWTWAAIAIGCALSYIVASAAVATASAVAFAWSESTDALGFGLTVNRGSTRAEQRRWFLAGVVVAGYAASVVDSALFVRIAFHSFDGWWQLTVAKVVFVMLATPAALWIRQRLFAPQPARATV